MRVRQWFSMPFPHSSAWGGYLVCIILEIEKKGSKANTADTAKTVIVS